MRDPLGLNERVFALFPSPPALIGVHTFFERREAYEPPIVRATMAHTMRSKPEKVRIHSAL